MKVVVPEGIFTLGGEVVSEDELARLEPQLVATATFHKNVPVEGLRLGVATARDKFPAIIDPRGFAIRIGQGVAQQLSTASMTNGVLDGEWQYVRIGRGLGIFPAGQPPKEERSKHDYLGLDYPYVPGHVYELANRNRYPSICLGRRGKVLYTVQIHTYVDYEDGKTKTCYLSISRIRQPRFVADLGEFANWRGIKEFSITPTSSPNLGEIADEIAAGTFK